MAEELRIHGASLSRIIKALYHKGYIYRDTNWGDSRQKVLSLTDVGQRVALTLAGCETRIFPVVVAEEGLAESR
jgi:DNA-binding MarR family transcriptional regulator